MAGGEKYFNMGLRERYDLQQKVRSMLSSHYRCLQVPRVYWYHMLHLPLESTMVDGELLEVVEDSSHNIETKPILLEDILEPAHGQEQFPRRILVEGSPFCGKTTLCYRLAMDWARDFDYLLRFNFAFLASTKYISQKKGDIEQMIIEEATLYKEDKQVTKQMLLDRSGSILIMFDEVEDCPSETMRKLEPFITREIYTDSTVVVFSRTGEFPPPGKKWGGTFLRKMPWGGKKVKWDKRLVYRGLGPKARRRYLEDYLTMSYPLQGLYSKLTHLFNEYIEELYRYPMYLLLMARHVEISEFLDPKTRTELFKYIVTDLAKNYDHALTDKEEKIELFDDQANRTQFYSELFNLFGELCLHKMLSDEDSFTESELIQHCRDNAVLGLGLLGRDLAPSKSSQQALFRPLHFSLVEFCAMYHLWNLSSTQEKKFQSIFCDKLKPLYLKGSTHYRWFLPFLVGLLDEKANLVFIPLASEAILFHADLPSLLDLVKECQKFENVLPSLLQFLPTHWWIHWQGMKREFAKSPLHKTLLTYALEKTHVICLKWHVGLDADVPETIEVDRLELTVGMKHLDGLSTLLKVKEIKCRELVCFYDGQNARVNYDRFINFVSKVKKDVLMLHVNDGDFVRLMPYVCREVKGNRLKRMTLHCTVLEGKEEFVKMFCDFIQKETILEALSVTIWPCRVKKDGFFKLKSDLETVLESVVKNKNLLEFSIHGDLEVPLTVPLDRLCAGKDKGWRYLGLDLVSVTFQEKPFTMKFPIRHLELEGVSIHKASAENIFKILFEVKHLTIDGFLLASAVDKNKGKPSFELLHIRIFEFPSFFFNNTREILRQTQHLLLEFGVPLSTPTSHASSLSELLEETCNDTSILRMLSLLDPPKNFLDAFLDFQTKNLKVNTTRHSGRWGFFPMLNQEDPQSKPILETLQVVADLNTMTDQTFSSFWKLMKSRRIQNLQLVVLRSTLARETSNRLINVFRPPEFQIECKYESSPGSSSLHGTLQMPQHHVIHILSNR